MPLLPSIAMFAALALLAAAIWVLRRPGDEARGHPKGLYVLFFTEMWERFSFYGMRALLVFYLTKHFLFTDRQSTVAYGAYTSLVFLSPILGGYLADNYLGQRKVVLFGAVVLTLGHLLLAIEGDGAAAGWAVSLFWLALACIIIGSGFLKGNVSVMVGQLYPLADSRRDGAYTIFYVGINLGGSLGVIIAGYLGETYGWSYGFGAAGLGMLLGLVIFLVGRPHLRDRGEPPAPLNRMREITCYGVAIGGIAVMWLLIQYAEVIQALLIAAGVSLLCYMVAVTLRLERIARDRMLAILFFVAINPIFWALFEQAGGSMNLYTDRYVDRAGIPASLFQSVNPIFVIVLGPVLAWLWTWLGRRGGNPAAPVKFALSLIQLGLSFLLFVWGARAVGVANATPLVFVLLLYLLQSSAELFQSPVGLSALSRLAPRHIASLVMGAWFYMTAVGNFAAGKIGEATGGAGGVMSKEAALGIYWSIGWWAVAAGVVAMLVSPFVVRLMRQDQWWSKAAPAAV